MKPSADLLDVCRPPTRGERTLRRDATRKALARGFSPVPITACPPGIAGMINYFDWYSYKVWLPTQAAMRIIVEERY
jgi:hypothetical protein